jgi:tetratricopeptide (TPR) repeat protein
LEKQAAEDDAANAVFEQNNPDFCKQFTDDMDKRKKSTEKKQESSNALKLKGNSKFKMKKYEEALPLYMEALKLAPYEGVAIVTNLAQVSQSAYLAGTPSNNPWNTIGLHQAEELR